MNSLNKKNIVITGGTQGIGHAIAKSLLRVGANIIAIGHENPTEENRKELTELGECTFLVADLQKTGEAGRVMNEAADTYGGLDHLINNAGVFADTDFYEMDESAFRNTFDLNVGGYFFCSQQFAKLNRNQKNKWQKTITCVGSINGLQAEENSVLYDSSKGAILMMIRSLAMTLSSIEIRVNGIAPGILRTTLSSPSIDEEGKEEFLNRQILLGRVGQPGDVSETAVYLCSDMSKYITGQMIYVDGGLMVTQATHRGQV